jgi:inorganic pyrophosphatase
MAAKKTRKPAKLTDIDTIDRDTQCVLSVIETPKGTRTKLAYDPERTAFVVRKVLPEGLSFPFDFGFIPSTLGDDGDPLDVLVLMDEPVGTGCIVPSRLIGVIEAMQQEKDGTKEKNARLIAVSAAGRLFSEVNRLADLPESVVTEIEHFFVFYNEEEGKVFTPTGRHGPNRAAKNLEAGRRRFRRRQKS